MLEIVLAGTLTTAFAIGGETPGHLLEGAVVRVLGRPAKAVPGRRAELRGVLAPCGDQTCLGLDESAAGPRFAGLFRPDPTGGEGGTLHLEPIDVDLGGLAKEARPKGGPVRLRGVFATRRYQERGEVRVFAASGVAKVATAPSGPPEDYLEFGGGGGFTGGSTAYRVGRDGLVWTRMTMAAGDDAAEWKQASRIDPARAATLFRRLDAAKFRAVKFQRPSNMSEWLARGEGGERHEAIWEMGALEDGTPDGLPATVAEVFRELRQAVGGGEQ